MFNWSKHRSQSTLHEPLIEILKSKNFDYRYLCSSDGPWTLTPMVLSQENWSFEGNNIALLNHDNCQEKLDEFAGSSTNLDPGQSVQINGTEFISLP